VIRKSAQAGPPRRQAASGRLVGEQALQPLLLQKEDGRDGKIGVCRLTGIDA
jgi:hypothetical protein